MSAIWCYYYYNMRYRQFFFNRDTAGGFALPTVLIAAVIMMMVLVSGMTVSSVILTALKTQYYNQLAREAASSGAVAAEACIRANDGTTPWTASGNDLTPNRDCSGNTISGASAYVSQTSQLQTAFDVQSAQITNGNVRVVVTGTVQLLRQSDSSVWKSYTTTVASNIDLGIVSATVSSSGIGEVCGIIDGNTWCWGGNGHGQLGDGTTNDSTVPVEVSRLPGGLAGKTDKLIAVGNQFGCIVTTDNTIYCWGYNYTGQLGNGDETEQHTPVPVDTSTGLAGKTITQIVAGAASACAIASGDVYCWGGGAYGQLGTGNTSVQLKPIRPGVIGTSNGKTVTAISGQPYAQFYCAIAVGAPYCWGQNDRGQVGDGTTTQRNSPTPVVQSTFGGRTASSVTSGGTYYLGYPSAPVSGPDGVNSGSACALMTDGTMWCWGSNQYGQMGNGTQSLDPQLSPVEVSGALAGKTITQITMGFADPCALTSTGSLYCWGQNLLGEVGDGTNTHRYSPTPVALQTPGLAGKTITWINGGGWRNCAIADGKTYCWGNNGSGQIGDGTKTNRWVPTESTFLNKILPSIYY